MPAVMGSGTSMSPAIGAGIATTWVYNESDGLNGFGGKQVNSIGERVGTATTHVPSAFIVCVSYLYRRSLEGKKRW